MGLFGSLMGFGGPAKSVTPAPDTMFSEIAGTLGAGIANLRDFEQQIAPAVANAVNYFDTQIAEIPGPISISACAHGSDPVVMALFPTSDEIRIAIGRSIEIREALPRLAASGHAVGHALLGVRCKAKDQTPGQAPMFVCTCRSCTRPTAGSGSSASSTSRSRRPWRRSAMKRGATATSSSESPAAEAQRPPALIRPTAGAPRPARRK